VSNSGLYIRCSASSPAHGFLLFSSETDDTFQDIVMAIEEDFWALVAMMSFPQIPQR